MRGLRVVGWRFCLELTSVPLMTKYQGLMHGKSLTCSETSAARSICLSANVAYSFFLSGDVLELICGRVSYSVFYCWGFWRNQQRADG
jgi:hypothetical protein